MDEKVEEKTKKGKKEGKEDENGLKIDKKM